MKVQVYNMIVRANTPRRGIYAVSIDNGPWMFGTKQEFEAIYDVVFRGRL